MLQAQQRSTPFWFVESAKLIKANGEPLRALHELENAISRTSEAEDAESKKMRGKVWLSQYLKSWRTDVYFRLSSFVLGG